MTSLFPSASTSAPNDDGPTVQRSSIRPRNRRLISTEQELENTTTDSSRASSVARGVSPIPSRYPSRAATASTSSISANGRPLGGLLAPPQAGGSGSSSPKWGWGGSWSTLQGLASSVLGGEVASTVGGLKKPQVHQRRRRASSVRKPIPTTWGPMGGEAVLQPKDASVGAGTTAEREAAVKARRTASVLESHEGVNGGLDFSGRFKRRTSAEDLAGSQDDDTDALVYVHHVLPTDTLAGIVLKYNCQPTVFRKANRLWPNDAIQIRKVVLLPVDACAVRGRPCDPPSKDSTVDLLAPTPGIEEPPNLVEATDGGPFGNLSQPNSNNQQSSSVDGEEPAWTHVRWVLLSSSPSSKPTEIARLPRKTLGYFPPRRRKSQGALSMVSTPRVSAEIPPLLPDSSHDLLGSSSRHVRNKSDTANGSYFPAVPSTLAARSITRRDSVSSDSRMDWMRGPGGVGTFNKNVRKPGPANDGLNAWATKHMPSLGIGYLPSLSAPAPDIQSSYGFREELAAIDEVRSYPASGAVTPNSSGAQGMGLEHAAAAIEGWMRRLAVKAATPGTPKLGAGGRSGPDPGDLIELLDGTGSDDGRGFEPTLPSSNARAPTSAAGGSGREDLGTSLSRRLGILNGAGQEKGGKTD